MDSNIGDDSDSIGNAPRTVRSGGSAAGAGLTMPTKEKRKPFFKKVIYFYYYNLVGSSLNFCKLKCQ